MQSVTFTIILLFRATEKSLCELILDHGCFQLIFSVDRMLFEWKPFFPFKYFY